MDRYCTHNDPRAMERAEELYKRLDGEGLTLCIRLESGEEITSAGRGVAPLLALFERADDLRGAAAADKVAGKAAAFLYALLGVAAVRTRLSSAPAREVFSQYGIAHKTDVSCDRIINRKGDGLCPMESAVTDVSDPAEGKKAIEKRLAELAAAKSNSFGR